MFLVVMWGLIGTVMLSFEIMANKWLMVRRNIYGNITGLFFMLTEGSIGTVCLLVTSFGGAGLLDLTMSSIGMLALASLLNFTAMIMLNFAIASGVAGVAISIFNTNASIQCVLSSSFLKQIITKGQIAGVVLSLFGASILSIGDMIVSSLMEKRV